MLCNPLKLSGKFDTEALNVKACLNCHSGEGFLMRGKLQRQHFMSIKFLVGNGQMPPLGIAISEAERERVLEFAAGL